MVAERRGHMCTYGVTPSRTSSRHQCISLFCNQVCAHSVMQCHVSEGYLYMHTHMRVHGPIS